MLVCSYIFREAIFTITWWGRFVITEKNTFGTYPAFKSSRKLRCVLVCVKKHWVFFNLSLIHISKDPPKDRIEKTPILCWFSRCVKHLCKFGWNRSSGLGGDVEDLKEPPKEPHRKNTYPMLVLPLRKIFVPSLVEIGPVV